MNSPASGWHRDPTARHEYRYWDGARWTDDVSDRGVTTTDPMPAGGPGADPTEVIDATQAYQTAPGAPPTAQQPGAFGPYGTLPPQTGGYGSYGSGGMPPAAPQKKGPNTPMLVGLGLLALVAVIVAVVLFTGGDDDDGSETADDPLSGVEDPDAGSSDEPADSGDSGDSGDPGGSSDTTDVPDDLGDLGSGEVEPSDIPQDVLADLVVDQLVASGEFTEEQATCVTERMFEELSVEELAEIGETGDMSSITPDEMSGLADVMEECMQ